jgi:hypothetical protein
MSEFVRYTEPYRRELIAHGSRRVLPSGLDGPADDPHSELEPAPNVTWLQVIPDSWVDDPAAVDIVAGSPRLPALLAGPFSTSRPADTALLEEPRSRRRAGDGRVADVVRRRATCLPTCRSGWRAG